MSNVAIVFRTGGLFPCLPAQELRCRPRVSSDPWNQLHRRNYRGADRKHPPHETRFQLRHGGLQLCRRDIQSGTRHGLASVRSLSAGRSDRFRLDSVHACGFQFPDGRGGVKCCTHAAKTRGGGGNASAGRQPTANAPEHILETVSPAGTSVATEGVRK